jgi:hypothetical protein
MPRNPTLGQAALLAALAGLPARRRRRPFRGHRRRGRERQPGALRHRPHPDHHRRQCRRLPHGGFGQGGRVAARGHRRAGRIAGLCLCLADQPGCRNGRLRPRRGDILALAATAHPDFDDTPLFDENGDGDRGNDGDLWHSHWVVLGPDETCGPGALKVIDIPEGATPRLPPTWPGLPLLIDSPGWQPILAAETVEVRGALCEIGAVEAAGFDGVTAGLRVNANVHAPLLCVTDVFDVASGDLSLPGKVNQ